MSGKIQAQTLVKLSEIEEGILTCNTCKETQPISEYYVNKTRRIGYQPNCRACIKARDIKRRYGLDMDAYEVYLRTPCPICDEPSAVLDHCHASGKVRDGLCSSCNLVLGAMQDDPSMLRRAAAYLEDHHGTA